jgi:hypothetical protein
MPTGQALQIQSEEAGTLITLHGPVRMQRFAIHRYKPIAYWNMIRNQTTSARKTEKDIEFEDEFHGFVWKSPLTEYPT